MIVVAKIVVFASLALLAAVLLCRPQISYWRWLQARREFLAHWGRLPAQLQQRSVALAWSLSDRPHLNERDLEPLVEQALDERWQAMQKDRRHGGDLVLLREDLDGLLTAAARGFQ